MRNRPRRLRAHPIIRQMVRETILQTSDLVYPLFVVEGTGIKEEVPSLTGIYQFSIDQLEEEIQELLQLGIRSILLYGICHNKDECGSEAYSDEGIVQQAIRKIKSISQEIYIITDVCMCQYTSSGHCGILNEKGEIDNDTTIEYLGKIALSHVQAGADMIAPSDMMDGRVGYIRDVLDRNGHVTLPIMVCSVKYASNFYKPLRERVGAHMLCAQKGTYQMDYANTNEAIREVALDLEEGADIVMIKPALAYLDVMRRARESFNTPIAAYQVSGEYAMLRLAIQSGILDEEVIYETLISIKRAGAELIITYFAKDVVKQLR